MNPRSEQALVGLFVLVATAVLVGTVFAISGAFGRSTHTYHSFVTFAGGIESGSGVRYSGGPKIGSRGSRPHRSAKSRAHRNHLQGPNPILPVKADSRVKIMSMSPLGDNHLEILPGTSKAALAPDGSQITAENYIDFNAITAQINDLGPHATELIATLNDRATELKVTLDRVNDLLSVQNRANLSATLANTRGMLEENRPALHATLQHINSVSEKLEPLFAGFPEDFRGSSQSYRSYRFSHRRKSGRYSPGRLRITPHPYQYHRPDRASKSNPGCQLREYRRTLGQFPARLRKSQGIHQTPSSPARTP